MKFGIKVMQSEPIKKLEAFANANKQTQGKFTIGDEKEHNVFMKLDVSRRRPCGLKVTHVLILILRIPLCSSSPERRTGSTSWVLSDRQRTLCRNSESVWCRQEDVKLVLKKFE